MLFAGCATQNYGRLEPLVESEAADLDCKHIGIEIDKCNAFIDRVTTANKAFTAKDVLSFLGDLGIGDSWEVTDALSSATERIRQLQELKTQKQCD